MGNSFGKVLRKYRINAGLSQEALGAKLGYATANYISCLELGTKKPSVALLFRIAEALGVKASAIISDMENHDA